MAVPGLVVCSIKITYPNIFIWKILQGEGGERGAKKFETLLWNIEYSCLKTELQYCAASHALNLTAFMECVRGW